MIPVIVILNLKSQLEILKISNKMLKKKIYDLTSQEYYNHAMKVQREYEKAIKILETKQ